MGKTIIGVSGPNGQCQVVEITNRGVTWTSSPLRRQGGKSGGKKGRPEILRAVTRIETAARSPWSAHAAAGAPPPIGNEPMKHREERRLGCPGPRGTGGMFRPAMVKPDVRPEACRPPSPATLSVPPYRLTIRQKNGEASRTRPSSRHTQHAAPGPPSSTTGRIGKSPGPRWSGSSCEPAEETPFTGSVYDAGMGCFLDRLRAPQRGRVSH